MDKKISFKCVRKGKKPKCKFYDKNGREVELANKEKGKIIAKFFSQA